MSRRLLGALAGLGAICLVVAGPQLGGPTLASWKKSEYVKATLTANFVRPPRNLSCSRDLILGRVTFTWVAPATGGATRTGYAWAVKGPLADDGTLGPNATSITFQMSLLRVATSDFTIWAVNDANVPQLQSTKLAGRIYVLTSLIPDCSVP